MGDKNGNKISIDYLNDISKKVTLGEIKIPKKNGIIITYMKKISKENFFSNIIPNITETTDIGDYSEIASKIYANTKNFNALHMVTASHALRYILKYISEKEDIKDFYYYFSESFLAVYLTIGAPEIKEINYNNNFSFDEIYNIHKNSLNDHDIKLCFTSSDEYAFYKKPIYKYIGNMI